MKLDEPLDGHGAGAPPGGEGASDGDLGILGEADFALCVADARSPDLPILCANRAFLAMSGYAADEALGPNPLSLLGPHTDTHDAARFHDALKQGRPFQTAIVNHSKSGDALRNEVFVSPIRDSAGEIERCVAIVLESSAERQARGERAIAALRHEFRNQIQTLTSLVALLGQRLPDGDGRRAFQDLRARFEAVNVLQADSVGGAPSGRVLTALAERVIGLFDPGMRHQVDVKIAPFDVSPRRTAALAQILTEMLIDLFRAGLGDEAAGAGSVSVSCSPGGEVRLRSDTARASSAAREDAIGAFGVAILESLVRASGGSIVRRRGETFDSEVVLPAEPGRR